MSHDGEMSGTATRKERRKAGKGEHQATARARFVPADYVRADWSTSQLVYLLETRALGYNGRLREILCTAAAMLRVHEERESADPPGEDHVALTDEAFDAKLGTFIPGILESEDE